MRKISHMINHGNITAVTGAYIWGPVKTKYLKLNYPFRIIFLQENHNHVLEDPKNLIDSLHGQNSIISSQNKALKNSPLH